MEAHEDNKLFFIMMAGLPCSGKTTLAKSLGKVSGWPVISKDLYKSSLIECGSGLPDEETGRIAYELLFGQAKDFMIQQGLSIIFDTSAHMPFILEQAMRIAANAGAEFKIIHCFAPASIRLERLKRRIAANFHHAFMLSPATANIENEFEYFQHLPADKLSIDTQRPIEVCLAECSQYILLSEKVLDQ